MVQSVKKEYVLMASVLMNVQMMMNVEETAGAALVVKSVSFHAKKLVIVTSHRLVKQKLPINTGKY